MPLSHTQRTALEASINSALSNIPNMLDKWNQTQVARKYQIEDMNEFVYGHILGLISSAFQNIIFISEGRIATREELEESDGMISMRLPEIRNAIKNEIYYHHRLRY
jgi:hypothetical protein